MKKLNVDRLIAAVAAVAALIAVWYAVVLDRTAKRQASALVPRAVEGITRGMPTLAQTTWVPTGDELAAVNRALSDIDAVIEINAKDGSAHNARGMLLTRLGDYEGALGAYGKAFDLFNRPKPRAIVLNNIGDVYAERCQLHEAATKYRASLGAYKTALATANLADCLLRQGKIPEALHEAVDAVNQDDNFVGAHFVYGKILWRMSDQKRAIEQYERAVQIDSKYQPETHLELSKALAATGESDRALDEALTAVEIAPSFAEAHAWFADLLERAGSTQEAAVERARAKRLMTVRKPTACP